MNREQSKLLNKWQKLGLGYLITLCLLPTASIMAQVENLSKTPNLSIDTPSQQNYEDLKMPEDYPQDMQKFFDENVDARSFAVVDTATNRILAQRQANVPYPIASMTKIMSAYLVLKAIDEGKITMDTMIKAPQEITDVLSGNYELSSANIQPNVEYSVKDLLYGVMLLSGNDATSVLMWHLYGSEQSGTQAIIDQLHQWGLIDFQMFSTSGLPNQYLPESWWMPGSNSTNENVMSAQDMAYVAQKITEEYPELTQISSTMEYTFKAGTEYEQVFTNSNQLLPGQAHGRPGINGLKSGATDAAGKNFVATGKENDRSIVAVAMGVFPREDGIETTSYWDIEILLDGLSEHKDLYNNPSLPTNKVLSIEERQVQMEAEIASEDAETNGDESNQSDQEDNYVNRRDNPLANFLGRFFRK